jgi:hypothetical protein
LTVFGHHLPGAARLKSGTLRLILFGMAAFGMLAVVIVAATAAIVLSGTAEIGLIRDRVQAALAERLGPGFSVSVGKTVMGVEPGLGVVVDIEAVEVSNADGATVMSVPVARLFVDALSLLALRVAVTRVELSAPSLALVGNGEGGYDLDGPPTVTATTETLDPVQVGSLEAAPAGGFPEIAAAVQAFDRTLGEIAGTPSAAGLSLELTNGEVTLRDPVSRAVRKVGDIDLHIDVGDGVLNAAGSAHGVAGRWNAAMERRVDVATGARVISMSVSELTPGDIFPDLVVADGSASLDTPLYLSAEFVLGGTGIRGASGRLDVGAGVFRYGDSGESILLDEASIRARWDIASGQIVVDPSSIHIGSTGGSFTGLVQDAGSGRYAFAFESHDTILAPRDSDEEPLAAELIELSGSADLPSSMLNLDRVIIQTRQGSFAAAGRLGFTGETPSFAVVAELTPMSIATWKQMWPPFLAPGARRWAMSNMFNGRIASARFEASVPAGILFRREPPNVGADSFRLDLQLEDVTVRTYGGLPPISAASGHAVLAGSTFGLDLASGVVRTPAGAALEVNDGAFAIDDVFDPGSDGTIEVRVSGDAGAIGEIANSEPFRVLDQRGLVPADLSGTGDVSVSVRVPLDIDEGKDPGAQVDWKVVVAGTGLASRKPVDGRTFTDADVTIAVTRDEVTINGNARIDGVRAEVSMAQPLSETGGDAPGAQQAASLALDREARLKLGLDIEDIVSGTVDAQVRSFAGGGEHYDLDLQRARLVIPGVGWSKGIGVPATMKFDVIPEEGGSRIENMVLSGEGFGFVGSARLGDGRGLVSASVTRFRLRPGDDLSLELTADASGYAITAEGTSFDARGVIAEMMGDVDDGGDTSNVAVEARVRKLRGFGDRAINDAAVSFVARDGVPRKLDISGSLRGGEVFVDYIDDLARASLKAGAADAGALLEYLDIYARIGGGYLAVTAERPSATGPLAGTLSMTGFAILDEPAMEEVISRARPRNQGKIDTTRMHVEQMDAVFRYTGNEIFVDEAFLRGSAMGATFNGVFDLVRSFVSMSGTYIPVYGINNAFSRVPVVGRILGGENAEGLIGVTFKVEGPIDHPRVFVNPLSAVAPGILRKIFEYR